MLSLVRAATCVVVAATLWCSGQVAAGAAPAAGARQSTVARVFYVDPVSGDDAASGRSTATPLRTLAQVAKLDLRPGDRVLLRAGVTHLGSLTAWQNGTLRQPILLDSYGTGAAPVVQGGDCVQVPGSYWRITGVAAKDCTFAGFQVRGTGVELRDVEATGNVVGIEIEPTAARTVVRGSSIHDNTRMAPGTPGPDDDYGANGIVVSGTDALITDNVIEGHRAPSPDYGYDGAAVEIWGATGTRVERNVARDNLAFAELGNAATSGTRFSYNSVTSTYPGASFLITRGASAFGPVRGTVATHNSVRLTGDRSIGISCHPNCTTDILTFGSNVIQAWDAGYAEAPDGSLAAISTGYNVVDDLAADGWYGLVRASTDVRAPAAFDLVDGALRLRSTSPGTDIGGPSWSSDIEYAPAPVDGNGDGRAAADAGAFERR